MRICYLDYESYWSVEHTLSKMNPITYVMHPETEIQSVSIGFDDWPIDVIFGEDEIRRVFAKIDWSDTMMVAHNGSGFDHLISAWRFGIKPKAWGCTLAMAKPFYALTVGGSLKRVSEAMGLADKFGAKGSLDIVNTKGKKLKDFTPDEIARMRVYNKQDTLLCREIFKELATKLSMHEMKLIDLTVRMTVDPHFEVDRDLLVEALERERERKKLSLLKLASLTGHYQEQMDTDQAAETMRAVVMSQPQFANLLRTIGAEVPMKESATTKNDDGTPKMIPALAKSDQGMTDLLEYEDPDGDDEREELVRIAAGTRLEVKSTQLETRLETYINVSDALGGKMPMPVNYCGAAITWRFSGSMNMNVQNMPRVNKKEPKPTDALRKSVRAPAGHVIVVVDSSNIELRVAHALAGQEDTVEKLRNKEDLYCWFASNMYGREITKDDEIERYLGKQAMLQLQFNASWKSFQKTARINSKGKVMLSDDEAKRVVNVWRKTFPHIAGDDKRGIVGMWEKGDVALKNMFTGEMQPFDSLGLCFTTHERILTPQHHWLHYPTLRKTIGARGRDEWVYGEGRNKAHIFGGKVFANTVQHLARLIVAEQTLQYNKRYPARLTCHDEAAGVVKEEFADDAAAYAKKVFSTPPAWWPDLPIACEVGVGAVYSEAK